MSTRALKLSLGLLFVAATALVLLLLSQTDFALRLRTQVPEVVPSERERRLQCHPTAAQPAGTYHLPVTATDEAGNSATALIEVNVLESLPPCADGQDNDSDGAVDERDSACYTNGNPADQSAFQRTRSEGDGRQHQCSDSLDNDRDGLIDGGDSACHTDGHAANAGSYDGTLSSEVEQPACSDGRDNDGDFMVDAADSACHTDGNPLNVSSYDRQRQTEGRPPYPQCGDSVDNDNDGLVDGGDPDCHADSNAANSASYDYTRTTEQTPSLAGGPARCADGQDNDGDGAIDAADSACHTDGNPLNVSSYNPAIDDEGHLALTQCADSLDNDNDGLIDGSDPQCHSDAIPANPATYNPLDDGESELLDDEEMFDDLDPLAVSASQAIGGPTLNAFTYEFEQEHRVVGSYSGPAVEGSVTGVRLAHERAYVERDVTVPRGDYWLIFGGKHDIPGDVDGAVYINNWAWKAFRLNQNDDQFRIHALGRLRNFAGGTVRFRFLKDQFDSTDPANEQSDRNLFLDFWALSSNPTVPVPAVGGRAADIFTNTSGGRLVPSLNQIIREELGPDHVNQDIWRFYARRLTISPLERDAITTEPQLREVMRYWRLISPARPRGS